MNFSHCFLLACDLEREQKTTFSGIGHWGVGHPVLLNVAEPRDRLVLPSVCIRACFTHSVWFHAAPPFPPLSLPSRPHTRSAVTLSLPGAPCHTHSCSSVSWCHTVGPLDRAACACPTGCAPQAASHAHGSTPPVTGQSPFLSVLAPAFAF